MLTSFERRQVIAILEAFAPPRPAAPEARDAKDAKDERGSDPAVSGERPVQFLAPREGEVDYLGAITRMLKACNPTARLGVRLITFVAAFAPFWMLFRFRTMATMPMHDRMVIVQRLLRHRVFFIKELMMLLKIGASMALLGNPSVRAQSNYERKRKVASASASPSRSLPIITKSVA